MTIDVIVTFLHPLHAIIKGVHIISIFEIDKICETN